MLNSLSYYQRGAQVLILVLLISGCAPYFNQPMQTSRAALGVPAPGNQDLINLPPPQQKVVAAVYKFRDQTGQYKPSATGASWSTAITQGTTTILLKSLEESGWFTPIERENLGNLLNERKIIRSTRAEAEQMTGKPEPPLPSLLFAGIILEGGIISYDANVITGGAGLRYFGAGGSGQYREDKVTVYLRAISTSTGEILKTVYTSKTILSQSMDFGVFRYVKFKRLLEAETGFTYNEPSEIAVKEAIDKAVQSMVIEGLFSGYWRLKNKEDLESPIIKEYLAEKEDASNSDVHGQVMAQRRGVLGVSLAAGAMQYHGDYSGSQITPMAETGLRFSTRNNISMDLRIGGGELATEQNFERKIIFSELNLNYSLFPRLNQSPYLQVGAGALASGDGFSNALNNISLSDMNAYVKAGVGMEFMASKRLGIDANVYSSYLLNDKFDEVQNGRFNDYFWGAKLGLNYYFGLFK
ncbi:CsgG/HfaB family protein [Pontibacter oryzae]|uniref:Curli production assembly/transport component CsgG n=1 Tax=Pontibacter oryzae TaxID=2304593 RepID=A0A399RX64_9BACT|nr:CsgG/HfaB family protein [Pontibacter oryzae]RIJ33975.1 curli production assembly/transport component CsgG [Pontibacter oryzae]